MKTQFLKVWMIFTCLCVSLNSFAQCDLSELSVVLKSTSPSEENCTVNVTTSFTIQKNKGNKYTYIHLWTPSTYPGIDYKKAPDKTDLGAVLATVAIHTDGMATLLPTYGPDNSVTTLSDNVDISEEDLGDGLFRITISNLIFSVPGACDGLKSLKGDVWSTQSEADKHPPVHCSSTSLPVKLAKLRGDLLDDQIALSWMTTEESGSSHFYIERSADLSEFVTLGSVNSMGTTTVNQNYSFIDKAPLPGNNYYRLKMVDIDGSSEQSRIIVIENSANSVAFQLLGNPASGNEIRFLLTNTPPENVVLHDLKGRNMNFRLIKTGNTFTLKPTTTLSAGMYILGLRNAHSRMKKILIP